MQIGAGVNSGALSGMTLPEMPVGSGAGSVNPNTAPPITAPISQETRADVVGFLGGMPIQLDREMSSGGKLGDKLKSDIATWLEEELRNQKKRIDKLSVWDKQYSGFKEAKSSPYVGCANTSTQTTRSFVDALVVRIFDAIFGQKKVFICTGKKPPFIDLAPKVEKWFDYWVKNLAHLKDKIFSPLLQSIKAGTGIGKLDYVVKNKTAYRYATPTEIAMQDPNLITFPNGQQGIKKTLSTYEGVDFFPIDRADWVISSDATCIDDVLMCGFRKWYRKSELEAKVKQGIFTEEAFKKITAAPDRLDKTKEDRVASAFKDLSPDTKDRYAVWELWVRYDVDEDGEEDDIVVNFHPSSGTVARAIYNPIFMGFRPFVDLIFYRKEFSTDGVGVCEIMEKFQEELDALHNQRIDRFNQINGLQLIIKAGSDLEDMNPHPGGKYFTNEEVDKVVFPIQYPDIYPSTVNEEAIIMRYAESAVGMSPYVMGQSTAERPVAKETIALIQELNKKFKHGIDNIRDKITLIGTKALQITSQYQPKLTYLVQSMGGGYQEETLDFPCEFLLDGLVIDMAASSEMLNTEIRREINLNKYFLVKDYTTNLASMVQAIVNPMIPEDFKIFVFACAKIGHDIMTKILEDFGGNDAEQMVPEIPIQLLQQNLMPPMPPPGKPPGKPGAKPGRGGPPGAPPQGSPMPPRPPLPAPPPGMMPA